MKQIQTDRYFWKTNRYSKNQLKVLGIKSIEKRISWLENYSEKFMWNLAQRDKEIKKINVYLKWWWEIDWKAPT